MCINIVSYDKVSMIVFLLVKLKLLVTTKERHNETDCNDSFLIIWNYFYKYYGKC